MEALAYCIRICMYIVKVNICTHYECMWQRKQTQAFNASETKYYTYSYIAYENDKRI